jgi:hypothetical protein
MTSLRVFIGFLLGIAVPMTAGLYAAEPLPDDGSHIAITAPRDGEAVGPTFELKYELHAGSQAHHAHVYLDGQSQKGFKGTFTNVPAGQHEITVVAANKDHKTLPASATVKVLVK